MDIPPELKLPLNNPKPRWFYLILLIPAKLTALHIVRKWPHHPWAKEDLSLGTWYQKGTYLTLYYSIAMWIFFLSFLLSLTLFYYTFIK
jgi:hypothetical protein